MRVIQTDIGITEQQKPVTKINLSLCGKLRKKTGSKLILVNYEDSREQFKTIEVKGLSDSKQIFDEISTKMNFEQFKTWFKSLAANAKK